MKAIPLSEQFFTDKVLPEIRKEFPGLKFAAGLVGNGSECFGYDDEYSKDHDWGIDFFIWLSEGDAGMKDHISELKYRILSTEPLARNKSKYGAVTGVQTVSEFYLSLIGCPATPQDIDTWIKAPEENFAMATNGKVFIDDAGCFSGIRSEILNYYPEALRLKRLSYCCMAMAQTGQYNLCRMAKRGDIVTVNECRSRFTKDAIHTVFLLSKKYMPYYKWRFKAMTELGTLGKDCGTLLRQLAGCSDAFVMQKICESICLLLENELRRQGISDCRDSFMTGHGESIHSRIGDAWLKSLPLNYFV